MDSTTQQHNDDDHSVFAISDDQAEPTAKISVRIFGHIYRLLTLASIPLFPDLLLAILIPAAIIAYMVGGYYLILAPGNLYNALVSEDWSMFQTVIIRFILIATACLLLKIVRGVLRESSANLLRKRLTLKIHALYLADEAMHHDRDSHTAQERDEEQAQVPHEVSERQPSYYKLVSDNRVDNPDQRVVADTRDFASSLFSIVAGGGAQGADSGGLIEACASILFYTRATFMRTGWYGVCAAYLWSLVVAVLSVFVINRTSPVLFAQERLEGDFRYAHAHLRRHVEEIAFLRGGAFECAALDERLQRVVSNMWAVIVRHFWLNGLQYGFGYYISIVMYMTLMVAVRARVFNQGLGYPTDGTAGEKAQWVSQTGGVFIQLLYSFTMLVQLATAVSAFVANVSRLTALVDALRSPPASPRLEDARPLMSKPDGHSTGGSKLCADRLSVELPSGRRVGPLSFSVGPGDDVVMTGPTGCGKTSLLRVLRRLQPCRYGDVRMPEKVQFAPQVAYIPFGRHSLRALVTYPAQCKRDAGETQRVCAALRAVGWATANPAIDERRAWGDALSPGERQLVAAARVIACRPTFAVLDEPTSSLDMAAEQRVIAALKQSGVSTLVVAHSHSFTSLNRRVIDVGPSHPDS